MFKKFYCLILFVFSLIPTIGMAGADLSYCINMALLENSEIKKARAEFNAFKEAEDQSFANLLPSVGLSVSRSKVNQERSDGSGLRLDQNFIMESDAISLRQPIYRPKLLKDLKRTRKEISSEALLLSNKEDSMKMKVAEVYFKLLGAYEEESLIEKRINLLQEQKKGSLKSIEAGRGTITELAEINAANDKASANLIRAKQNIRLELNELQFYTGQTISKIKKLNKKKYQVE